MVVVDFLLNVAYCCPAEYCVLHITVKLIVPSRCFVSG